MAREKIPIELTIDELMKDPAIAEYYRLRDEGAEKEALMYTLALNTTQITSIGYVGLLRVIARAKLKKEWSKSRLRPNKPN